MTVRTDVVVDWAKSPRIIEVEAPSTSISIQDLVDTCRTIESELDALDNEFLIYATGKDKCGDITTGITLVLNNAKIKFEDRPPGEWVVCTVGGGNLGAIDSNGNPMDPREPAAYVNLDISQSSSPTIAENDPEDIADTVWTHPNADLVSTGIERIKDIEQGRWKYVGSELILYKKNTGEQLFSFDMFDIDGKPTTNPALVYERRPKNL